MSSSDAKPVDLGPSAEAVWLQFKHHLDWSQGFTLGFLFSSSSTIVQEFRRRLQRIYRTRVAKLQVVEPEGPKAALEAVMAVIRNAGSLEAQMAAPLWVELQAHRRDQAWETGRALLLARLNEHRELMRQRLSRPIILVLPSEYQMRVRELAPDLWSIRDFSLEADKAVRLELPHKAPYALLPTEQESKSVHDTNRQIPDSGDATQADILAKEWRRLQGKNARGPDVLNAGWRAVEVLLQQKRWAEADTIADEVLVLAREQQDGESAQHSLAVSLIWKGNAAMSLGQLGTAEAAYGESLELRQALRERLGDGPEVLRDLSVSLDNVGDVARAQGRLEAAEAAYGESLELRQALRERLGDGPEVLRDLSVSLDNVGDVARAQGRLEAAEAAYGESLELRQALRERLGDGPEVLRDLSVSLDNVGDVARAQGRLEAAEAAYGESLELRQALRERLGDGPEVLRDLSVSLNKVGDVARAQGRLEAAEAAYGESLELRQALRERLGDGPEVLRDLSVSLDNVGDVARAQGRLEAAEAAYGESLELMQALRERLGDGPEVLRDLSVSLNKVGDVARAQGRLEAAEAAYGESLELRQALRERLGDGPEVLRDLSVSLNKVGDVARAQGRLEAAEAAYDEAIVLLRRLDHVFPGHEYADWLQQVQEKHRNLTVTVDHES